MESALYILAGSLLVALLLLAFFIGRSRRQGGDGRYDALRSELNSSLASNMNVITGQMQDLSQAVVAQLASVTNQLNSHSGQLSSRMDNATRIMGDVKQDLGVLSKATSELSEIGRDISGLGDILAAPKARGGLGEFLLGDLLASCLPAKYFSLQHTFRSGKRVDAVIRLSGGILSVDSKFPLENFKRLLEAENGGEKTLAKKKFISDCKSHVDAIADSYILPGEGTLDFALMYVPAENVYYEMALQSAIEGGLIEYAFKKKVIPVSPNTFYLYMQTILMGLKGFEISKRTGEIRKGLERLSNDFAALMPDFDLLGRHLRNAALKHDDMGRKVRGFGSAISDLSMGDETEDDEHSVEEEEGTP
ncbi:MAG: DNA recombination protein RmuC [Thermodesulfobacteriota bacterium]